MDRPGTDLHRIVPPATLDGGDVLKVGRTVYVGRSARTNEHGITAPAGIGEPEPDLGGANQVRRLAPDGVEDRVDPQTRRNQPAKARQSSEIRSRRTVVPG